MAARGGSTMNESVNYWAILTAALANLLIGALWYSPRGFAQASMKYTRRRLVIAFSCAWILSASLSFFIQYAPSPNFLDRIKIGLWIALGIVATSMASHYRFGKRRAKLYFIDVGYSLVAIVVASAILAGWR